MVDNSSNTNNGIFHKPIDEETYGLHHSTNPIWLDRIIAAFICAGVLGVIWLFSLWWNAIG